MQNGTAFVGVGFAGRKGVGVGDPLGGDGLRLGDLWSSAARKASGASSRGVCNRLSLELGHAGAELVSLLVPIG